MEAVIGERLTETGQSLATAESCSGGLIAHRITNVAGASAYFLGGVVAYSNVVKEAELGIPHETLAAHGAVSEAVARAMAKGIRGRLGADFGLAVTGLAGPSGATVEKPVGLVFIALAGPEGTRITRNQFTGSREAIKAQTAETALRLLWEYIA